MIDTKATTSTIIKKTSSISAEGKALANIDMVITLATMFVYLLVLSGSILDNSIIIMGISAKKPPNNLRKINKYKTCREILINNTLLKIQDTSGE